MTTPADSPANPQPLIEIDVWTDVVCPWCYIGEARLYEAIEAEGLADKVRLRARSFELDPTSPAEVTQTSTEMLAAKMGVGNDVARAKEADVAALAEELGRDFAIDRPFANTRAIHRVMQAINAAHPDDDGAAGTAFFLDLQRGYFSGTLNPFEEASVLAAATAHGLSEDAARAALTSQESDAVVEQEIQTARQMGAGGVPFFVFNNKFAAPGALPTDTFRQALRQVAADAEGEGVANTEGTQA